MLTIKNDKIYLVIAANYQCFSMWTRRYGIVPYSKRVRYIDNVQNMRGYDPKGIVIVSVCSRDWPELGVYQRRGMYDVLDQSRLYRKLGAETVEDTCIDNPPTLAEREAWERRRRQSRG